MEKLKRAILGSKVGPARETRDFITASLDSPPSRGKCPRPASFWGRASQTEDRRGLRPASVGALRAASPSTPSLKEATNPRAISPIDRRRVAQHEFMQNSPGATISIT